MKRHYYLAEYFISRESALLKRKMVLVKALNEASAKNLVLNNVSWYEDSEFLKEKGLEIEVKVQRTLM